ncbi:MAG TPA: hypothetical protein VFW13_06445 [Phenylobacterium sp.]|nr:hypothetical protein [Phenylobacterium sp.]
MRVYRINGAKLIEIGDRRSAIGDRMRYDLQEATMTPPKASTVKRFRENWQAAVKAFRADSY